jgi:hypothetical protein
MALASSSRNGARIIWVALHTAEGSRRRSDLYNFFDTVRSGSSHGAVDGTGLDDGWVPDDRAAWTLLNGNPVSLNLEMCGFARWSRAQWLSEGTVDGVVSPRQMVRNAAEWARRKCERYGIPKVHIGADGVAARRAGIIMHRDYTYGAGDGDHTDIGHNFPWDVFFADMAGGGEEDDMFNEGDRDLLRNVNGLLEALRQGLGEVPGGHGPATGKEVQQAKHDYESQHLLRNIASMTGARTSPGPLPDEGQELPLVSVLRDLAAAVEQIKADVAALKDEAA